MDETLKDAAEYYAVMHWGCFPREMLIEDFTAGAKWQQDRSYSKEDVIEFTGWLCNTDNGDLHHDSISRELTPSIGFSPHDCLVDGIMTSEELFEKWLQIRAK